jgi:hypothetical protein
MQSMASDAISDSPPGRLRRLRSGRVRIGAVIAVGLAAAFVAWLVLDRVGDDSKPATQIAADVRPAIMSLDELSDLAASTATPLYWAGPRRGTRYEVTRTRTGTVYVRYLAPELREGDAKPALTVVTYPLENALARIRAGSTGRLKRIELPGGGLAVIDPRRPTNVHFAYPGQAAQVEVYAPQPGLARRLVVSGAVRPL